MLPLILVWADHADAVSKHYSGTGALKTDFTRYTYLLNGSHPLILACTTTNSTGRRTKSGAAQDGWNSVVRYVKNNFLDGRRQDAYDLVLGRFEVTPMRAPPASATKGWAYYVVGGDDDVFRFMEYRPFI